MSYTNILNGLHTKYIISQNIVVYSKKKECNQPLPPCMYAADIRNVHSYENLHAIEMEYCMDYLGILNYITIIKNIYDVV